MAACRSFFGQWGPNATTWLLPSELFPTETRAMSHGLAAATGKVAVLAVASDPANHSNIVLLLGVSIPAVPLLAYVMESRRFVDTHELLLWLLQFREPARLQVVSSSFKQCGAHRRARWWRAWCSASSRTAPSS